VLEKPNKALVAEVMEDPKVQALVFQNVHAYLQELRGKSVLLFEEDDEILVVVIQYLLIAFADLISS